MYLYDTSQP